MTTVAEENITLEDAVQKSKSMNATSYLWIIEENVLNLEIPEDHTFDSIGVVWNSFTETCTTAASFTSSTDGVMDCMRGLKEDGKPFTNLEELREAYPKLFEVTGEFRILTRR